MCIFFVNVLLRNENTEKIQVKKMINDPFKNRCIFITY
jgi:uncharacterized protein (DUF1919 family)